MSGMGEMGMLGGLRKRVAEAIKPIGDAIEKAAPHKEANELYGRYVHAIEEEQLRNPLQKKVPSIERIKLAMRELGIEGKLTVTHGRQGNAESQIVDVNTLASLMHDALEAQAIGEYYLFDVSALG